MLKRKISCKKQLQIGIWKGIRTCDFVWFDEENSPRFCVIENDISFERLKPNLLVGGCNYSLKTLKFVASITSQYTWIKTLLLPHSLTISEYEQQCRFLLSQELPIIIDDIWFDYQVEQLKEGVKLTVYAVKKKIAEDYLKIYQPLSIQVLDCISNTVIRAFHYFIDYKIEKKSLFFYQDEVYVFIINPNTNQIQTIHKTKISLTTLYEKFCQRYSFDCDQVYYYSSLNNTQEYSPDWIRIDTDIPFIALGNALWK
ncbi:hypothetical protein [Avibacterium paragallinarum]|uniref:hypothetical protein n=1 Tax=Avibacterium paragallinarum TaxID=728 RepID=UPI00397C57F9